MTYEELMNAYSNDLVIKEKPLLSSLGRIRENKIAIKRDMSTVQKTCILAEEIGHFYTAVGDIFDIENIENRKQENKGRAWAYNELIGLNGIIESYEAGCQSIYSIADYLEITEDFLLDAIKYYKSKYGIMVKTENYIIYFEPFLSILKLF